MLNHLRQLIHETCPDVEETIKWKLPHFVYKGMLCGMAAFKRHCAFVFWHKAMRGATEGREGLGQLGKITCVADLPAKAELKRQIRAAMELNEKGIKSPRLAKSKAAKKLKMSGDFAAALKKNSKAQAAFDDFSPSHRNE